MWPLDFIGSTKCFPVIYVTSGHPPQGGTGYWNQRMEQIKLPTPGTWKKKNHWVSRFQYIHILNKFQYVVCLMKYYFATGALQIALWEGQADF